MAKKGERYRNHYTGQVVEVKAIESVRIGPGETYRDVVVLEDGTRWRDGDAIWPNPCFHSYHDVVEG